MLRDAVPPSLLERAMKYAPLLRRLETRGARIMDQQMGIIRNVRRIEAQRVEEEEIRILAFQRRRRDALALHRARTRKTVPAVSMMRRLALGEDISRSPLYAVSDVLQDSDNELSPSPTAEPSKKATKSEATLFKPDPFVVGGATYREMTSSRLVCRKCDHTLTRGVRGVHLFSWYDNYHMALNEELADTISFKEIVDQNEAQRSLWKRAKVACPCCGTSVGSLGVAHARMKVMFKGVCVVWRSTADIISRSQPPMFTNGKLLYSPHLHSSRPMGSSLPSSWLHANAGLMTHSRRWVLDSTVINQVVEQLSTATKSTSISEAEPSPGSVVRVLEKEPTTLSPMMKKLALRSMAAEHINSLDLNTNVKTVMEVLAHFERLILAEDSPPTKSAPSKKGDIKSPALDATPIAELVEVEDAKEEAYELDRSSSLGFVRFACLDKIAQMRNHTTRNSAKIASALKTPAATTLRAQCASYLKQRATATEFVATRVLCSSARSLTEDKDALLSLIDILAKRKDSFGPAAGAFGRSAEYLKSALEASQLFTEEEITEAMARCSSPHPSPGGRFGDEYEASGFVALYCTHGTGTECDRRATHAPAPSTITGVPPNMKDPKLRIPVVCRVHAPAGYLATAEGYKGVIPPYEDPHRGKPGPLQVVSAGYPSPHDRSFTKGWYPRRNNRMVDVPDPHDTTFGPPEPGTLHMGQEWEQKVKVCYSKEDLSEAVAYFENHIAKAEELTKANGGIPSAAAAIGLDVEWKPEFIFNEDNNVCSIIQVATRERAFVFDAIALGAELDPLMRKLFRSKDVIKMGHGLGEDLARIAQALSKAVNKPGHQQGYFPVESVMELAPLFAKAESKVFAYGTMPSLVSMVEAATGMKLDKRCQMTDWERRPLSPAQVRYAATDAACGFLLFDYFANKIQHMTGLQALDLRPYLQTDSGTTAPQRAGTPYNPAGGSGAQAAGSIAVPPPFADASPPASVAPALPSTMTAPPPPPGMFPAYGSAPPSAPMAVMPPRPSPSPAGMEHYAYPPSPSPYPPHYGPYAPGGGHYVPEPPAHYHNHHHPPHHHHPHHAGHRYPTYHYGGPRMSLGGRMGVGSRLSAVPRASNRKILSKQEWRRVRELRSDLMSLGVRVDQHAKLEGLEVASEHLQKSLSKVVRDSLVDPPQTAPHSTVALPPISTNSSRS